MAAETLRTSQPLRFTPFMRNVAVAAPLLVLTLLPFTRLADWLGVELSTKLVLLGALGWWLALVLRVPVMLLAKSRFSDHARTIITAVSGPAEELVRLGFLLLIGLSVDNAVSLAIGWAAIEIVYALVQGVALGVLQQKDDEKARAAKGMMRLQGLDRALEDAAPFWGILERLSANALHMSFSLMLVISPWLVLIAIPLHSVANFLITGLMRSSFLLAQGVFLLGSVGLLALTLLVHL